MDINNLQTPPQTRRDDVREIVHGVEIVDPYRWLEKQTSPETREWIDSQNKYTDAILDALPEREAIAKRLDELIRSGEKVSAPFERGGRYFLMRRRPEDDLWIMYFREGLDGEDKVIIDPHGLSEDHTTTVGFADVSDDGKLLLYSIREGGEDEVEIRSMDLDTLEELPFRMPKARYMGISLKNDKSGIYYAIRTPEGETRIFYHEMETELSEDKMIFGEGYTKEKLIGAHLSENGRYLLISVSHGWSKNELYVMNVETGGELLTVVNDIDGQFHGSFGGNTLFIQTDWEAPNKRIISVDPDNPSRENWKEIVPTGRDAITGFSLTGGKMFVHYLHNVTSQVKVFTPSGEQIGEMKLPGIGSGGVPHGRWESSEAFYSFQSFTTPSTIYRYDTKTGDTSIWFRDQAPLNPEDFEEKQVWFESKDGTRVPMFLVQKKGIKLDGNHPTLLTGYGGFDASLTPGFNTTAIMWCERGGVFAMPNLRGGGEFGEAWHKAGMLENKQNVFDDFIAAAEWLISNKYTSPSKLAIQGGSNGGLLVGAAITQRPDLFRAVICGVPLLDMVHYHMFLLGPVWVPEYGSAEDPKQFKYLYAYSPYHRFRSDEEYPSVLFVTGDADTRVDPLHARKMCALMQTTATPERPAMLMYDTKAGHSGGKPLSKQIEDLAKEYAYLLWQLGTVE